MTDLSELVEPLKRELAIPGTFATVFPDTTDSDLQAALADGFSEAQLWGFFPDMVVTENAGSYSIAPDLSAGGSALIIIFTGMRIIRAQLRSMLTAERYKGGPAEVEFQRSANLLRDELKFLSEQRAELIKKAQAVARASAGTAHVFDNYTARTSLQLWAARGGFYDYELMR